METPAYAGIYTDYFEKDAHTIIEPEYRLLDFPDFRLPPKLESFPENYPKKLDFFLCVPKIF